MKGLRLLSGLAALVAHLPEIKDAPALVGGVGGRYYALGLQENGRPWYVSRRTFEGRVRKVTRKFPETDWEHRLFARAVAKRQRKDMRRWRDALSSAAGKQDARRQREG